MKKKLRLVRWERYCKAVILRKPKSWKALVRVLSRNEVSQWETPTTRD